MQTAATGYDLVLDPAAYQVIQLIESDGIPMDSAWHFKCAALLIAVVEHTFRDCPNFYTGGNMFVYFNPDQARNRDYRGPDFFFIKDGVDRDRARGYWAIWKEQGRRLDVIVELLSPTTEEEDRTTKFTIYEQTLQTPEYFLYDPLTEHLEGWRLLGGSYVPLEPNDKGWLWSEEMGLWLGIWVGTFLGNRDTWLRLYSKDGQLAVTAEEAERQHASQEWQRADQERQQANKERQQVELERLRAEQERQRAEQERQRADQERQHAKQEGHRADQERHRADQERQRAEQAEQELARLRELLRQQPPPKPNGAQS